MAGQEISKEESLSLKGYRHACHIMLYADTDAKLFGKIPIKHIVLMQMRFDGLLGFPGGLVNPAEESLESGLSRELWEEMGVALNVAPEDHRSSRVARSPPHLVTHFYTKQMKEEEVREVEKAAVTAPDHGLEGEGFSLYPTSHRCGLGPINTIAWSLAWVVSQVMGMVRVPLYRLKSGEGGFPAFLSHSFISDSRSQLLSALGALGLLPREALDAAVTQADQIRQSAQQ